MTANWFLLVWKWCQARLRFKIRVRSNWRSNQTENLKSRKPAQAMPKCLNDMLLSSQLRPTPLCCVLWCYDVFLVYSLLSDLRVTAQLLLKHISRVDDHKVRLLMLSSGRCTALTGAGGRAGTRPAQALPSSPAYEYSYPDFNCNTRDKSRKAIYSIGKNVSNIYGNIVTLETG